MQESQDSSQIASVDIELIAKDVKQLIRDAVNLRHVDLESLPLETGLGPGGLNLDSVDILELAVAFEQKYKIKLTNIEMAREHFQTLGSIVQLAAQFKSQV